MKTVCVTNPPWGTMICPIDSLCLGSVLKGDDDSWVIDLSRISFASISQACLLAELAMFLRVQNRKTTISKPSADTEHYFSRMNFNRILGFSENERFARHNPSGRFLPMQLIREYYDTSSISNEVAVLVNNCVPNVHKSVIDSLRFAFAEVMDNTLNHSDSRAYPIAGAQYYPRLGCIEICVADCGRGIAATLADNPQYSGIDDAHLVSMAFNDGTGQFIGRPDYANNKASLGRGLYITSRIVAALGGTLWVFSKSIRCQLSFGNISSSRGYFYPGTALVMRLPVRPNMIIVGSQLYPEYLDKPICWDANEGGFYYYTEGEGFPLW